MYMGDLTRYQLEFVSVAEGQNLAKIAKKYYLEALSVDQNQGQPFNQLAALSGSQCHGIIAVYYYLRCLTSEQKFEGAEGNLKKILDKASSSKNSSNDNINKQMIVSMMALFQNLLYEDSTKNLSNVSYLFSLFLNGRFVSNYVVKIVSIIDHLPIPRLTLMKEFLFNYKGKSAYRRYFH